MRRIWLAAVLGLAVALGASAPKRDPDIEALVERAKALPPEFAADTLLRLANSTKVSDFDWKQELIDEAWHRTYAVQEPYRRMAATPPADTRQAALTRAYDMGLDRVSLQARAARAMAPFSAARAREIFEWIDFDLKPSACDDPLVAVLDDYYETLAVIARSTFGSSPDDRAEALLFFELYSWKAARPSEMASLVKGVQRYQAAPQDAQYLESVLGWVFDRGARAPREFSTIGSDFVSRIGQLDEDDRLIGVIGGSLVRGLRRYMVAQLTGPRCSDSASEGRAIADYNRIADRRAPNVIDLRPISAAESRPSGMLGPVRYDFLWQTAESRRLRDEGAALFGDRRGPTPVAVKRQKPWQDRAEALLVDLDHWVGTREPAERDYLYEKSVLLTGLTEIVPAGVLLTRAVRTSVNFLRYSAGRAQPGVWFTHVSRLLELARGSNRALILDAFESSGEPAMGVYARLERLQPTRRATR